MTSPTSAMQVGALVPQGELGDDPGAIRAYAQGVEDLGYTHLLAYDHVLGAGVERRPGWTGPYTATDPFHEPLTLFTFMAAATTRLGFVTGVFVLPQRQTALVAKQAAELAILSGDRFRLGVGLGWNEVEYEALGVPYAQRAARYEEQLVVLRRLWTEPVVDFHGRFHRIDDAGLNPLPGRPVPLWLGCGPSPAALDRVARLGDGWIPAARTASDAAPMLDHLRAATAGAGRDPGALGIEARLILHSLPRPTWATELEAWRAAGATHLSVSTAQLGLATIDDHLDFLASLRAELGLDATAPPG